MVNPSCRRLGLVTVLVALVLLLVGTVPPPTDGESQCDEPLRLLLGPATAVYMGPGQIRIRLSGVGGGVEVLALEGVVGGTLLEATEEEDYHSLLWLVEPSGGDVVLRLLVSCSESVAYGCSVEWEEEWQKHLLLTLEEEEIPSDFNESANLTIEEE